MKRLVVVVIVFLVAGFIAISFVKQTRKSSAPGPRDVSGLSKKRKAEIRSFWAVYHGATDLRLAGDWEGELLALREALVIDPRHEGALYYQGNALFELGRYDEAVASWRHLVEVNPLSARAHFQLGAVYSCGAEGAPFDLEVAEKEFSRALAINKEETGPIVCLGEVSLLNGQDHQALTYFTTAIRSNFESVRAYYLTGYLRWRAGETVAALEALQEAVKYSRPRGTDEPLREGDIAPGSKHVISEGASRKSFFAQNWMALRTWDASEVSMPQMEDEYDQLDRRLRSMLATTGRSD